MALVALLAACATSAEPTTTTTTVAVASVPDPTTSTSTTAPAEPAPIDICEDRTAWEANTTLVASCFLVPLTFTPDTEGWRAPKSELESIEGIWVEPGERDPAIRFVVLAHMPDAMPSEAIESILAIDGVDATAGPTNKGTRMRVDVESAPVERVRSNISSRTECAETSRLDLIQSFTEPGYVLLDQISLTGTGSQYGLGACRIFRIWAIPIDDITLTVVATTDDLERFDELMPTMEQLVDSIRAATP